MALLVKVDGSAERVEPKNGASFSLEELQGYVGGYIQIITPKVGERMVINKEGKLMGLPINKQITDIAHIFRAIMPNDFIVGDVLLCKPKEIR